MKKSEEVDCEKLKFIAPNSFKCYFIFNNASVLYIFILMKNNVLNISRYPKFYFSFYRIFNHMTSSYDAVELACNEQKGTDICGRKIRVLTKNRFPNQLINMFKNPSLNQGSSYITASYKRVRPYIVPKIM